MNFESAFETKKLIDLFKTSSLVILVQLHCDISGSHLNYTILKSPNICIK